VFVGLNDIIAAGVAIADSVTKSLQVTVTHKPWASTDSRGKHSYGAAVARKAIVERLNKLIRPDAGDGSERLESVPTFKVTFLIDVVVTNRDSIVLADGKTGPILGIKTVDNPSTGRGYVTEVLIGEGV
jgi:hypothetical protein